MARLLPASSQVRAEFVNDRLGESLGAADGSLVVEADAEVQKRDYWLVYLGYRHITAALIFSGKYSVGDPATPGDPGSLLDGPGLWCVPGGTPVEIASSLTGWMIGRAGMPPQAASQRPGPAPDQPEPHGSGNVPRPDDWISTSAFPEGQHRDRLDPDEWTG